MHLISWDTIKLSKSQGGLGLKDLKQQNKAYIMKLCWGILTKPDTLWVRCLRSKYRCGEGRYPFIQKSQQMSMVWRSIVLMWDLFYKWIGREVRSGTTSNFWWDV